MTKAGSRIYSFLISTVSKKRMHSPNFLKLSSVLEINGFKIAKGVQIFWM